jgi:hypothetical protein
VILANAVKLGVGRTADGRIVLLGSDGHGWMIDLRDALPLASEVAWQAQLAAWGPLLTPCGSVRIPGHFFPMAIMDQGPESD